jgi:myo-inositol-1(or 4)-monophosphatase
MDAELSGLRDFAVDIARGAGRLLMAELPLGRWRGEGVERKAGRELVSRVDRASEALLIEEIRDRHPSHAILAEEGGPSENGGGAPYRWIIDPLDGTTNFLHGPPMFSVSLAVEKRGTDAGIAVAVVHLPYVDETYFAVRGAGAFLNTPRVRLSVSLTERLDEALVASGFAYDRERWPNYDNFVRLARHSLGIRRSGSAAIDLAFVAAGRYDAYWELGLKPWDVAAGALLVQEAGGRVGDFSGGDGWLEGGQLLATNGRLFEAVQALLDPPPPQ